MSNRETKLKRLSHKIISNVTFMKRSGKKEENGTTYDILKFFLGKGILRNSLDIIFVYVLPSAFVSEPPTFVRSSEIDKFLCYSNGFRFVILQESNVQTHLIGSE